MGYKQCLLQPSELGIQKYDSNIHTNEAFYIATMFWLILGVRGKQRLATPLNCTTNLPPKAYIRQAQRSTSTPCAGLPSAGHSFVPALASTTALCNREHPSQPFLVYLIHSQSRNKPTQVLMVLMCCYLISGKFGNWVVNLASS